MSKGTATRLVATVGIDVDDKRYEAGATITGPIAKWQHDYLIREGYAIETEALPADTKAAIEAGAATPHPIEGQMDVKPEEV